MKMRIKLINPFAWKIVELSNGKFAIKRGILNCYKDLVDKDFNWERNSEFFGACQSDFESVKKRYTEITAKKAVAKKGGKKK